jgi:hypothetical protein
MGQQKQSPKEAVEDAAERAQEAIEAVKDKLSDPIRKDG